MTDLVTRPVDDVRRLIPDWKLHLRAKGRQPATITSYLVTVKINLTRGSWTLFCDPHRAMRMFIDIQVGGVGQVG